MKKLSAIFISLGLLLFFVSCDSGYNPENFTVTYTTEHGTAPEAISVEAGAVLSAEQLPAITAEGFAFNGWFDGEKQAVAGEYVVAYDVTLTAKWEVATPNADPNEDPNNNPDSDPGNDPNSDQRSWK